MILIRCLLNNYFKILFKTKDYKYFNQPKKIFVLHHQLLYKIYKKRIGKHLVLKIMLIQNTLYNFLFKEIIKH